MTSHVHDEACAEQVPATTATPSSASPPQTRWKAIRDTTGAVVGTILGVIPHVMHHIGILAGAALLVGTAGNAVLYVVGMLFSVPMLRRLHRRFHTYWAPVIAVAVFTGLFSLSAFVIGPAISGAGDEAQPEPSAPSAPSAPGPGATDHSAHHGEL